MLTLIGVLLCLFAPVTRTQCAWTLDEFPIGSNPGIAGTGPCAARVWSLQQVPSGVDSGLAVVLQTWNASFISPTLVGAWQGTEPLPGAQTGTLPAVLRNLATNVVAFDATVFGAPPSPPLPIITVPAAGVAMQPGVDDAQIAFIVPWPGTFTFTINVTLIGGVCSQSVGVFMGFSGALYQETLGSQGGVLSASFSQSLALTKDDLIVARVNTAPPIAIECRTVSVTFTVSGPDPSSGQTDPPSPTTSPPPTSSSTPPATSPSPVATTPPATTLPPFIVNGTVLINGPWSTPTVIVFNGGVVNVNGTAFISNGSVAEIVVSSDDPTQRIILVNATGGVVGTFSDVQVTQRGGACGSYVVQSQDNNGATLSVLLRSERSGCGSRNNKALIIGVVAGAVGLVLIALVILYVFRGPVQTWAQSVLSKPEQSRVT